MSRSILIVGSGAIGAFHGSRLAQAPAARVSCVCRSNYKAVFSGGFQITSTDYGNYTWKPEQTFATTDEAIKAKINWDYVVIATKVLPKLSDNSKLLEGLVGPKTSIVLVQNGLGIEEPYYKRFPGTHILSAVAIASVAQTSPAQIKHFRWTKVSVGPYLVDPQPEVLIAAQQSSDEFVSLLQKGGIEDAETFDASDLQLVRWHKIATNAAFNPTAVLSGGTVSRDMVCDPDTSQFMIDIMHEVVDAATRIVGRPMPARFAKPEQTVRANRTTDKGAKPSMLLDWEEGKPMELEVILGNPIRIAREKGIALPRLQALYALLKKMEANRQAGVGWVGHDGKPNL